jgi:hypothetical protein
LKIKHPKHFEIWWYTSHLDLVTLRQPSCNVSLVLGNGGQLNTTRVAMSASESASVGRQRFGQTTALAPAKHVQQADCRKIIPLIRTMKGINTKF